MQKAETLKVLQGRTSAAWSLTKPQSIPNSHVLNPNPIPKRSCFAAPEYEIRWCETCSVSRRCGYAGSNMGVSTTRMRVLRYALCDIEIYGRSNNSE